MADSTTGKQNLLQVAEDLFIEHGYQAVSIRDIAQAAGVTNAALYYYFPNKEALFSEVLSHHVECLNRQLRTAAGEGGTIQNRLKRMLMAYCDHVAESRAPLFLLRIKAEKSDPVDKENPRTRHGEHFQALMSPFEEELAQAVRTGLLRSLPEGMSPASLLLGLFHGLIQHRRVHQDWTLSEQDISLVVDLFWKGMSLDVN